MYQACYPLFAFAGRRLENLRDLRGLYGPTFIVLHVHHFHRHEMDGAGGTGRGADETAFAMVVIGFRLMHLMMVGSIAQIHARKKIESFLEHGEDRRDFFFHDIVMDGVMRTSDDAVKA